MNALKQFAQKCVIYKLFSNATDKILATEDYNALFIIACGLLHVGFLILFAYLHIYELFVTNIFSCLLYLCLIIALKKYPMRPIIMLTYAEIIIHQVLAMHYTGTYSGFNLLLGCLMMTQFSFFGKKECVFSSIFVIIIIYTFYISPENGALFNQKYLKMEGFWRTSDLLLMINTCILLSFAIIYGYLANIIPSKKIKELQDVAQKDFLTGLYNRKFIENKLKTFTKCDGFLLAICDIDNFKGINDTQGHQVGDIVLKSISILLLSQAKLHEKNGVFVTRWGGEEFLLVAKYDEASGGEVAALTLLEQIRMQIQNRVMHGLNVTISIGAIYGYYDSFSDYEDMLKIADDNLYECKRSGKNKVILSKFNA